MLRETAAAEVAALRQALATLATPEARLARLIDEYLPSLRRDQSWVLWIDVWGEALRDANIRRISEDLDGGVGGGPRRGDRRRRRRRLVHLPRIRSRPRGGCAPLLDGLGLQVVLHQGTMTRAQMRNHVRRAAALELGHDLPD